MLQINGDHVGLRDEAVDLRFVCLILQFLRRSIEPCGLDLRSRLHHIVQAVFLRKALGFLSLFSARLCRNFCRSGSEDWAHGYEPFRRGDQKKTFI